MVDSHHMIDPHKCIAIMLLSLKTMMQIGLPHVNILSKLDLMETYDKLRKSLCSLWQIHATIR